jgi:hypothetical protein
MRMFCSTRSKWNLTPLRDGRGTRLYGGLIAGKMGAGRGREKECSHGAFVRYQGRLVRFDQVNSPVSSAKPPSSSTREPKRSRSTSGSSS